jgi:hypothetical protein
MSNKFFNVNNPKQIVTIVEDKDKFYELSDGNMIKKDTFMQKYQPVLEDFNESTDVTKKSTSGDDTLDPDSFFNTPSIPEDVIKGVKQADPTRVPDVNDKMRTEVVHKSSDQVSKKPLFTNEAYNESLVKKVDDSDAIIPNNTNTDVSQYKVYDNDDEAYEDFMKKSQSQNQEQTPPKPKQTDYEQEKEKIEMLFYNEKMAFGEEEAISRRNKRLNRLPITSEQKQDTEGTTITDTPTTTTPPVLSPIEMMFSTFKRKHPITINVEFEDMIGDPDFVKLMVENMDGDIVGYYKKMVMENIMKDLSKIEIAVEEKIKHEIFGDDVEESTKPSNEIVNSNVKKQDKLIPGGKTKTGKQKYKYVDENGTVKELLPKTAKTKGYEPYTE